MAAVPSSWSARSPATADFAAAREQLALPALGSFLWDPASTAALNDAELTNHDFLEALRHLAFTRQGKVLRPVDYKNLGAEELGGVYESLLALTPQISADGARFTFAEFAGNERKTSGSYYTPDSLVQCLLDSALDPVVEEAIKGKTGAEAEKAILALKVCDPAVGSGHFLVGAAHRLARHLARVRALAPRRERTLAAPLPARAARRDRPLPLRRGHQPDGRRAVPREPVARSSRTRQAALLPRPPHPRRQQPAGRDA